MNIGLPGFVFLIFLAAKLFGFIDWSWWWVTSPLWIVLSISGVVGAIAVWVATRK